ncbi:hypothetical protein DFH08DRAFT_723814 [Mycena albidolilacea]|uniref:DDE-1 domain-containing protein n=1 Tax=Mycena albidolilacea TaxID=1033008 RepID=A0AAD7E8F8_9AGAR|nr:hypothetical protein DFH08DRAFT_723814 [Mycena albidolilacea]
MLGVDSADQTLTAEAAANLGEEPLGHRVQPVPALRRTKLVIPQAERRRIATAQAATARANILVSALTEIDKLIASKKDVFHAGSSSLRSYCVRAIQSHLHMVVRNWEGWKPASETAAEAQGFATQWGARMVRKWTCSWISDRVIPESQRGKHGKSYSLYDDPVIRAELCSYARSEKWAMDPTKLVEFSQQKMVPAAVDKYLRKITEEEMPIGLKNHMEVELFPRISFKVGHGVSLRTARCLLQQMTAQCNDGPTKSWVLEGEQPLCKKGVGRGLHHSDVICSTVGYILDAGEELEYGKSYEGYWDGTKFMVQLKNKIIPVFEATHGPGYQMLLMVDHSQGHCMYCLDALLVSRMNLNPGGKQAVMRDGWWMDVQKMTYPPDHPGEPKGMKVYLRDHCDYTFKGLKANMPAALASVSRTIIRKWEHRMICWMEAYRSDLGPKKAQRMVRAFSSITYKSHRRAPERLVDE